MINQTPCTKSCHLGMNTTVCYIIEFSFWHFGSQSCLAEMVVQSTGKLDPKDYSKRFLSQKKLRWGMTITKKKVSGRSSAKWIWIQMDTIITILYMIYVFFSDTNACMYNSYVLQHVRWCIPTPKTVSQAQQMRLHSGKSWLSVNSKWSIWYTKTTIHQTMGCIHIKSLAGH